MLYFAYGSNLHWRQMKERCPFARFVGIAKLPAHRLAFTRKSVNRGCGVADVVPDATRDVWGVVYEIDDRDLGSLDKSEGFRPGRDTNSYLRRECMVFVDGKDDQPITAHTYFAVRQPAPPLPNQAYKDQILAGAEHWRLPAEYLVELRSIEVCE